jgi:hypothetical protein
MSGGCISTTMSTGPEGRMWTIGLVFPLNPLPVHRPSSLSP